MGSPLSLNYILWSFLGVFKVNVLDGNMFWGMLKFKYFGSNTDIFEGKTVYTRIKPS